LTKSDSCHMSNIIIRVLTSFIVLLFGLFVMIIPVFKSMSSTSEGYQNSVSGFVVGILFFLLLPNIICFIITMKAKKTAYVLIPAIMLLIAEYYFFHDFQTWIASDANAAVALLFIPIYLLLILGLSYLISFLIGRMKKVGQ